MRAFIGITLTGPVLAALERTSETIRTTSPAWGQEKWVHRENLHITIRFLGEVPEDDASSLSAVMAGVASHHRVHDITLAGVVVRPRPRAASMLWATFAGAIAETTELADALSDALAGAGYGRAERPFAPHATLVRARRTRPIGPDALAAAVRTIESTPVPERTMSVAGVTLFSSTLTPHGPHYDVLTVADLVRD